MFRATLLATTLTLMAGTALAATDVDTIRNPGHPFEVTVTSNAPTIPREIVSFGDGHVPGTIIVNTAERRLYLVLGDGKAMRYGIGVGRPGFAWSGEHRISAKREWPDWRPPEAMLKRRPDLPRFMAGGEANPLGARAMYLGNSMYRIHGSNEPESIGYAVSSGCIRMLNEDVIDLYSRVQIGTRVVVR
ncbi:MAG TPA: L,D-transpeptidase [Rhabdaerophilum sp.]|nr:L,D-transpeptidase [Rhabdaerophilum sp.]